MSIPQNAIITDVNSFKRNPTSTRPKTAIYMNHGNSDQVEVTARFIVSQV